jgi:thiol-disulfide isomerase/thioredoxin
MFLPIIRRLAALSGVLLVGSGCSGAGESVPAPVVPVVSPVVIASDGAPNIDAASPPSPPVSPVPTLPGWLGVGLKGRSADQPGVVVSSVLRGSPAASHGVEVGDIVLGINDERVHSPEELSRLISKAGAGGRANLMLERQDQHHLLAVQLGQNPGLEGQLRLGFLDARAPELAGVEVAQGDVGPTLQALRGRVVVLEFWATWCGACRALLPTLNAWHERYQAEGALVLSVTTDPVGKAAQDASELGLHYPVLSDPKGVTAQVYQAFALPTLFVIDRAGVVRDVSVGYDPGRISELEATLKRLISEG